MSRWQLTDEGEMLLLQQASAAKRMAGEYRLPGDAVRIRVKEIRRGRGWLPWRASDTVILEFFVVSGSSEIATFPIEQRPLGERETLTVLPIHVSVPISITKFK
jgi:hypothetical protein